MLMDGELRERLAEMISKATDGEVDPAEVLAGHARLADLGVTSLAQLRLLDAIESEFGVALDPAALASLDALAEHLSAHG